MNGRVLSSAEIDEAVGVLGKPSGDLSGRGKGHIGHGIRSRASLFKD